MPTETTSAGIPAGDPGAQAPPVPVGNATSFVAGALRLFCCSALAVLSISLLVLATGPSEPDETRAWVVAFALALPGGLLLAAYLERRLATAAPAATARALAGGLALLALGFVVRRTGHGDHFHHAVLVATSLGALAMPFLAARIWRRPGDDGDEFSRVVAGLSLALIVLLFLPRHALEVSSLVPALALMAIAVFILSRHPRLRLGRRATAILDVVLCVLLAAFAIQLPELAPYAGNILLHHLYYLGPANDVLNGRAMVGTAWSQYGVAGIDTLALVFSVVPIGFGTLTLIVVSLTAIQYVCVYAILRLAGLGLLLTLIAVSVAALGNLFAPLEVYSAFPSDSPLRFGIPYLIVLCAVLGARFPRYRRTSRAAILALLAIAAVWSFDTFSYAAGTYGALVLVEALARDSGAVRHVIRGALLGLGVSVAAVLVFSLCTWILSGHLDWGPYVEYLQLYSTEGFSQLPIEFFSAGPLMAAAIFTSAVLLLWLVRASSRSLSPAMRAAIAGFTGFAIVSFTYYLGRSHPNNLLVLLVPVVAITALWMQALLASPLTWWRTGLTAALALGLAMIAVAAWPSLERKAGTTALGLAVPGGRSLSGATRELAGNPVLDPRAPVGVAVLARFLPPGQAALVITDPDLTTEILMSAGRRNVLPISHAPEDDLIASSRGRVRAAANRVPPGTLMLTSPVPPPDSTTPFTPLQMLALRVLHQRFRFVPVYRDATGLEMVRLTAAR